MKYILQNIHFALALIHDLYVVSGGIHQKVNIHSNIFIYSGNIGALYIHFCLIYKCFSMRAIDWLYMRIISFRRDMHALVQY